MRNRVSIGDSAAASAWLTTRRNLETPTLWDLEIEKELKSASLVSPAYSAMSAITTASISPSRMQRSLRVRRIDVVRTPRRLTISEAATAARRTTNPDRADTRPPLGIVTSIGSQCPTSRPWSHAEVRPEKTADCGRRKQAACNRSSGLSGRPAQAYTLG